MLWFLRRGTVPFLVLAGLATAIFSHRCLQLRIDRDNRSMTADNWELTRIENRFTAAFGHQDPILVAVERADITDAKSVEILTRMVERLRSLEGVRHVNSVVDTGFAIHPAMEGLLISGDRTMAGIRIVPAHPHDEGETLERLIQSIRRIADEESKDGTEVAVAGLPLQKYEAGNLVRQDQRMFAPLSFLMLGALLFLITRRITGVIFPLLVAALTICWTLGIYSMVGQSLNMVTSLLPPVMMTLSVATSIHIYLEWLGSTEQDRCKRAAEAVRHLYKPCLFASLTTAIGFMSLTLSPTPAVRHFGMYAALGVCIAYFLGVIGLAVALSLTPPPPRRAHQVPAWTDRLLQSAGALSTNHPWKILAVAVLTGTVAAAGLFKINTDTDILRFLGSESRLAKDTARIAGKLAGVSSLEWIVQKTDGSAFTTTRELQQIQSGLAEIRHVRKSLSIADFLPMGIVPPSMNGNEYLDRERKSARLTVHTDSIGTRHGAILVNEIQKRVRDIAGNRITIRPVGPFYRVIEESNQLVSSQVRSFAIAIILILVAIGIVFRSIRYTLLAIIPNVIPLLITGAVMGFCGIALSTGTVMIASVVLGIAVDDTIHYLSSYRRSPQKTRKDGIIATTRTTGFALFATTAALSSGFWVAAFGNFQPTVHFALLSGITMWFALACDLVVLPALLQIAAPRHPHHSP